jgi:hypothetical protein
MMNRMDRTTRAQTRDAGTGTRILNRVSILGRASHIIFGVLEIECGNLNIHTTPIVRSDGQEQEQEKSHGQGEAQGNEMW